MRRIWSRIFLVVLCLALLAGNVFAGETTLILRFRPIESGVCAIDSIYGVSANYQNGATIYCSELITRFYQTLYGVDVLVGDGPIVTGDDADTYWFEPTTSPSRATWPTRPRPSAARAIRTMRSSNMRTPRPARSR